MTKQCLSGKYLWQCGQQTGFECDISGKLVLEEDKDRGIYISRTYDSGIPEAEWNRVVLYTSSNALLRVDVYLFDEHTEADKMDGMNSIEEKYLYLREHAQYTSHYHDMLLYGKKQGTGRFARLAVELLAYKRQDAMTEGKSRHGKIVMSGYVMSFPKESFTGYLPVIYRNNIQLERFLAVQQCLYLELEQSIDNISRELDYEYCNRKQLVNLAKWMGWGELVETMQGDIETDQEDILRQLLSTGIYLNSRKGTGEYYEKLAKILIGQEAILLEDPGSRDCTLLIRQNPTKERKKYLEWIRKNTPIGIRMNIVILHRTDRLDDQYFLDYTSYLAEYESKINGGGSDIDRLRLM